MKQALFEIKCQLKANLRSWKLWFWLGTAAYTLFIVVISNSPMWVLVYMVPWGIINLCMPEGCMAEYLIPADSKSRRRMFWKKVCLMNLFCMVEICLLYALGYVLFHKLNLTLFFVCIPPFLFMYTLVYALTKAFPNRSAYKLYNWFIMIPFFIIVCISCGIEYMDPVWLKILLTAANYIFTILFYGDMYKKINTLDFTYESTCVAKEGKK